MTNGFNMIRRNYQELTADSWEQSSSYLRLLTPLLYR